MEQVGGRYLKKLGIFKKPVQGAPKVLRHIIEIG